MNKKSSRIKLGAGLAVAGVAATSFLWVSFGKGRSVALPAHEAVRVIDGDTFETKEGQHFRLASTEAPELAYCGGEAAKKRLEELVLGRLLYIKLTYVDWFKRPVAYVYSGETFVNEQMIREGLSEYVRASPGEIGAAFTKASQAARAEKLGIFGSECTQMVNPDKPDCKIKGNLGQKAKIYYLPDCGVYPNVVLQRYKGDEWFCTEAQAKKAGFRKPAQCP